MPYLKKNLELSPFILFVSLTLVRNVGRSLVSLCTVDITANAFFTEKGMQPFLDTESTIWLHEIVLHLRQSHARGGPTRGGVG